MASFRWVLLLLGIALLALVFAYTRGWIPPRQLKLPKLSHQRKESVLNELDEPVEVVEQTAEVTEPELAAPRLEPDSKIVAVRIMPQPGLQFPAEPVILALRAAGLKHGQFDIFHCQDEDDSCRTRYSVAALAEPGSFDLSKLKDSQYPGISIFMVLPAPENSVDLFDDMLTTARSIARDIDGRLVDEQGGALSLQRERYMREEVIQFHYQHNHGSEHRHGDPQDASAAADL